MPDTFDTPRECHTMIGRHVYFNDPIKSGKIGVVRLPLRERTIPPRKPWDRPKVETLWHIRLIDLGTGEVRVCPRCGDREDPTCPIYAEVAWDRDLRVVPEEDLRVLREDRPPTRERPVPDTFDTPRECRVSDPSGVYEDQTVVAGSVTQAKLLAIPLMYGCPLAEVDERHVADMLDKVLVAVGGGDAVEP